MIRVGLCDDQPLFSCGVAMVVGSQADLSVAWQAGNGAEGVDRNQADPVDVLLMDVQMPVLDGIAATRTVVDSGVPTRVVLLTTFDTDEYVVGGLAAGASGFLLKDTPPEELLAAIRTVHAGDSVISARSTRRLLHQVRPLLDGDGDGSGSRVAGRPAVSPDDRRALEGLTQRETEILVAVAKGWTNTEICERLFVSMPTVKTHVGRVLTKTGARDRVQAVLFAFRTGLVHLDDLLGDA